MVVRQSREKRNLFSYGSNNVEQLSERLQREVVVEADDVPLEEWGSPAWRGAAIPAYLQGYGRVFRGWSRNWGGGVATIERDKDRTVFGYMTQVSERDLAVLDRYEGVRSGNYKRSFIKVVGKFLDEEAIQPVVVYVSRSREFNEPTRAYLDAVAQTVGDFWRNPDGSKLTRRSFLVS